MANSRLFLDIEANVKCGICLDVFSQPIMLECQHSFCKECVNRLTEYWRVACPQCRKVTPANMLKDSLLQKTLVEVFNNSQEEVKKSVYCRRGKKRDANGESVDDSADANDMCDFCKSFKSEQYCCGCMNLVCKACLQCHKIFTQCKDAEVKSLNDVSVENNELLGNKLTEVQQATDEVKQKYTAAMEDRQKDRASILLKIDEVETQMLEKVNNYCEYQKHFIQQATKDCIQYLEKSRDETVKMLKDECQPDLQAMKTKSLVDKVRYTENVVANVNEKLQSAKECKIPSNKVVFRDGDGCRYLQFSKSPRITAHVMHKNHIPSLHQLTYRKFYRVEKIPLSNCCMKVFVFRNNICTMHNEKLEWKHLETLSANVEKDVIDISSISDPRDATVVGGSYIFITGTNGLFICNGEELKKLCTGNYHSANMQKDSVIAIRQANKLIFIDSLELVVNNGNSVCNKTEQVLSQLPAPTQKDLFFTSALAQDKLFVCSSELCCIYVTDLKTGIVLKEISKNYLGEQCVPNFPCIECYDGRYLLISGLGRRLKLYDCNINNEENPIHTVGIVEGDSQFASACLVSDGRLITSDTRSLYVYD